MDQCNSSRWRKGVYDRRGNQSLFATFQERRSQKNRLNEELMWSLVASQHDFHGQYPPQGKEKLFLNDILCLKGRSYLRSRPLARNRTKQILRCNINKRMNFNCPVAETNESIEPNDNNLELNAIAYTFSEIDFNPNFNLL